MEQKNVTVISETEVSFLGLRVRKSKWIDFDKLVTDAQTSNVLNLHASGDEDAFALREVTPEELLEALQHFDAQVEVTRNPVTGEIDAIHASVGLLTEDGTGVVRTIQATGPTPSKLLGDLAQTSVGGTGSEVQVIGLAEWTIDWKRKTADATTTDDDTYESSLGSTASWTVKAKYMFIDGDTSQSTNILATITTPTAPQQWNFFPTIATGRAAFSGNAYVDGITIASGMGKVVGLDISLKGTGKLNVLTQIAPVANPNTGTGETAEI
ncbi:MAG TPA: hypothetical protein VLI45_09225 [Acidobacteriaceae bacterium]|nr:hypothetical protein [Acidobacteriaceae bacterium]